MNVPFKISWKALNAAVFKQQLSLLTRQGEPTGFLDPNKTNDLEFLKRTLQKFKPRPKNYCLIGIGGSALPTRALITFFNGWEQNNPKLWVLDTIDPSTIKNHPILKPENIKNTLFHIVSKSGSTLEVNLLRQKIESQLRRFNHQHWSRHFLVTTTLNENNSLERWAQEKSIPILPLDAQIGGRFSMFSPVSFVAADYLGLNLEQINAGAIWAQKHLDLSWGYAQALAREIRRGRDITGIFLYAERLEGVGDLLLQLFAESLGKKGRGLTPMKFSGTRDQHSLLQLYLDGPKDKCVSLLGFDHSLNNPLERAFWAAREGVVQSLKIRRVPCWSIILKNDDEFAFGALIQFFHLSTVALGLQLRVNPFDQPMVELQKKITTKLMEKN